MTPAHAACLDSPSVQPKTAHLTRRTGVRHPLPPEGRRGFEEHGPSIFPLSTPGGGEGRGEAGAPRSLGPIAGLLARLRGLFPARPPLLDLELLSDARLRDLGFFDGRGGKLPRGD